MRFDELLRRWRRGQRLAASCRAVGVALVAGAIALVLLPPEPNRGGLVVLVSLVAAVVSRWIFRLPQVDERLLAQHLDRVVPAVEDSSDLLVGEPGLQSGLERLQAARVEAVLEDAAWKTIGPRAQIIGGLRILMTAALVSLLIVAAAGLTARSSDPVESRRAPVAEESATAFDLTSRVGVVVRPPIYTGLPIIESHSLDLEVLEGSLVTWRLSGEISGAEWSPAEGEPVEFEGGPDSFVLARRMTDSTVYRILADQDGNRFSTAWARLAVVPDASPRLRIVVPQERVTTLSERLSALDLTIKIEDDHGLESLELVTTLAQGSGEQVEFRQRREPLIPVPDGKTAILEARLDLSELGEQDGSELYFFVEAHDNREPDPNTGRTSTYIVRSPAPRSLSAGLGEGLPIVLPPEYFRSQRQIIIDTEALLRQQPSLSDGEFERRSENLGFDQRALRLRYGTLLGEEFESGRPVEAGEEEGSHEDHGEELEGNGPEKTRGRLTDVPEDLVHFHDSAEIATFFTSDIRAQLKQVLAQMWEAEGQLRVHLPRAALPFEYSALELLKELQHRSRIYVQKVGFETPPLEVELLRLTGDLDEIANRSRAIQPPQISGIESAARELLAILPQGRGIPGEARPSAVLLRGELVRLAVEEPTALDALNLIDSWLAGVDLDEESRVRLAKIMWRLVPGAERRPGREPGTADPLARAYRSAISPEQDP